MSDEKKPAANSRGTRPRQSRIEVWVTPEEKAELTERAEQAGLSLSSYMKAVGFNTPIQSKIDLVAVAELAKVNGDLGRVAGLLKFWLAEKRGQGARPVDVEKMMFEFKALQTDLLNVMAGLVHDR